MYITEKDLTKWSLTVCVGGVYNNTLKIHGYNWTTSRYTGQPIWNTSTNAWPQNLGQMVNPGLTWFLLFHV